MPTVCFFTVIIILLGFCYSTSSQDTVDPSKRNCIWSNCGSPSCSSSQYPYQWASGKCGGPSCSGGSSALYCCDIPSPYVSTYWLGTALFCGGSCNDCNVNDECIIGSNPCGDGERCWTGSKALCGRLDPDKLVKRNLTTFYILGAIGGFILVALALLALGGSVYYCCINCDCCGCCQ